MTKKTTTNLHKTTDARFDEKPSRDQAAKPPGDQAVKPSGVMQRFVALCLLSCLLVGCAAQLAQPYPQRERFSIPPFTIEPHDQPAYEQPLRIERIRIAPPFDGRSFVYRLSDTGFEADYYHQFIADPSQLFTERTTRALAQANLFPRVIAPGGTADVRWRLETHITDLYGDYRDPHNPTAYLRARFLLLEDQPHATNVVGEWTLDAQTPIDPTTPNQLPQAWANAYRQILQQLATAIAANDQP